MAEETRDWTLPGPAALCLEIADVRKILHVSERTLHTMIQRGEFPHGKRMGNKLTWTGADIAAYLHLRGRFIRTDDTEIDQQNVAE